ncbi:MAG: heme-binding protein, partial [Planctomycetaceae bacterium]|nr:heme-binding protein [Planctomycetaceae bacterium]
LDQKLSKGRNVIAVAAKNDGGVAAFVLKLKVETASGEIVEVTSSPEWSASLSETENWQTAGFPAGQSVTLSAKGKLGIPPWQIPTGNPPAGSGSGPLAADQITVPDGFEVELIYTVPKETEGSWVCLTTDPWGHLLASDQGGQGLYRIKVDGTDVEVKKVPANLSGAQGMTWAFNALYFNRSGGSLYRAIDTDNDQLVDTVEELPSARGGGEHGNHAVEPTEDGKQLYVVAGNHTDLPPLAGSRVPTWDEDLLLPRQWDARGHARGRLAPGGWVSRFDPEQKTYELYCIGFRNEYDIALNEAGDIFTYDADMEWDMGMPWYRPTRICQVVSGADYGWRSGTGKWPTYYEDSLPPVVEIGPGSPTGVVAGTNAAFPAKYRRAIFALDWTFGTIYAIHLKPEGAGYTGEREWFCFGAPLPVTDATIGKDGAMYFAVGGRGTQSALYRVRYTGKESTDDQYQESPAVVAARATRKKLEAFHGKQNAAAVTTAWPYLSSSDRFLRHAARIALESQPVESWSAKLRSEQDPQAIITGCVALARIGESGRCQPGL